MLESECYQKDAQYEQPSVELNAHLRAAKVQRHPYHSEKADQSPHLVKGYPQYLQNKNSQFIYVPIEIKSSLIC